MTALYCVECGCCSGDVGKGWVAMRDDPVPELAFYCECVWEPLPAEAVDGL